MPTCEILETDWDKGQVLAGKITLKNGKLQFSAEKGFQVLVDSFKEEAKMDAGKDLQWWMKSLPRKYSGTVLRVKYIE